MSPLAGPPFLRTSIGRLAVAGAATLVTVMGFAPAAVAADDLAPESSEPVEAPQDGPATPDETTPPAGDTAPPAEQPAPLPQPQEVVEQGEPQDGSDPVEDPAPAEETDDAGTPSGDEDGAPPAETPTAQAAAAATQLTLADDDATVTQGRTATIYVLLNDASDDPIRSLTIDQQGEHGEAEVLGARDPGSSQPVPGQGTLRIQYQADADYVGNDTVTYRVTTEDGTTDTATISIEVQEYVAPPVTANFGQTKVRVGVEQADGSYVPAGATTAGSVIRIQQVVTSGPAPEPFTCTTYLSGEDATSSTCNTFYGTPGATYEITQESAATGFVRSTKRFVIDPCVNPIIDGGPVPICDFGTEGFTFVNRGSVLPEANDDAAASSGGEAVDVDVLANDTSEDPQTTLEIDQQPRGGTAEVVGEADRPAPSAPGGGGVGAFAVPTAGDQVVRYTPEPGFEGIDDFTYRLTNSNGSDTATVTVAVSDNGAVTPIDPVSDTDGEVDDGSLAGSGSGVVRTSATASLPSTGGPDAGLLVLGGALLAGGAAAVAGSRRRRDVAGG